MLSSTKHLKIIAQSMLKIYTKAQLLHFVQHDKG